MHVATRAASCENYFRHVIFSATDRPLTLDWHRGPPEFVLQPDSRILSLPHTEGAKKGEEARGMCATHIDINLSVLCNPNLPRVVAIKREFNF